MTLRLRPSGREAVPCLESASDVRVRHCTGQALQAGRPFMQIWGSRWVRDAVMVWLAWAGVCCDSGCTHKAAWQCTAHHVRGLNCVDAVFQPMPGPQWLHFLFERHTCCSSLGLPTSFSLGESAKGNTLTKVLGGQQLHMPWVIRSHVPRVPLQLDASTSTIMHKGKACFAHGCVPRAHRSNVSNTPGTCTTLKGPCNDSAAAATCQYTGALHTVAMARQGS